MQRFVFTLVQLLPGDFVVEEVDVVDWVDCETALIIAEKDVLVAAEDEQAAQQ